MNDEVFTLGFDSACIVTDALESYSITLRTRDQKVNELLHLVMSAIDPIPCEKPLKIVTDGS